MVRPLANDTQDLVDELRRDITGEVRFDKVTRAIYSTDASIYQIEPIGVVLPKIEDDVIAVIEVAKRYGVPVLPRGGGTSLAGQAIGHAIVIDFSKYMRNILDLNTDEGWVKVQPGVVLDELNLSLKSTGMHFAPDPSTSNRSNVGGALGNNSCGAHSVVWGKTIDNVRQLQVILSDGSKSNFGSLTKSQFEAKKRVNTLEGQIYKQLQLIGELHKDEIEARYPKIMRRVSGYNLDELLNDDFFNMARFVVGSEGTLVTITEAKLKIVPLPMYKALAVLHFKDLFESMDALVSLTDLDLAAVELVDKTIIRQARNNLEYSRMMDFIDGDPDAILIVEVFGDTQSETLYKLDKVDEIVRSGRLGYSMRRVIDAKEQAKVWAVRKAGLGLMMNVPGELKPIPFVEDSAVSPDVLADYVRRFDSIVRHHGTTAGYYGHASVGCLHIRPMLNLRSKEHVDLMVSIASEISDLVLEFGGSISGEHGDGIVRSGWLEKMFGTQLYRGFHDVKEAFDPSGIMNPGKIINAPSMKDNLRIEKETVSIKPDTKLKYSLEGGYLEALEMCNGQGACRKTLSGTMCPSYMVTRDEEHSTRGRANALRSAMSGRISMDALTNERLYEVLDLCLECKGCKAECPSNVDMSKLKHEFLAQYSDNHGISLRNRLFGNLSTVSRLGSLFAPISNWTLRSGIVKGVLSQLIGLEKNRDLPLFSTQTFSQWFNIREKPFTSLAKRGEVVLFVDTFTNYNYPELGQSATKILESMGYEVILPNNQCCGRPMLSNGMLDKARANATANVEILFPYVDRGAKIVGIEPSCLLSFRDDYLSLLGDDKKTKAVSDSVMLFEEFYLDSLQDGWPGLNFVEDVGKVLLHGHCHQKAIVGTEPAIKVLDTMPGCEVEEIVSGCCGMAGSFGYESEHFEISMKIGEQVLFPAIRSRSGEFTIVSEGVSCRQQIEFGTGIKVKHLVEFLADAIK